MTKQPLRLARTVGGSFSMLIWYFRAITQKLYLMLYLKLVSAIDPDYPIR